MKPYNKMTILELLDAWWIQLNKLYKDGTSLEDVNVRKELAKIDDELWKQFNKEATEDVEDKMEK